MSESVKNGPVMPGEPPEPFGAGRQDGDVERYLILATPQEAQRLLTECGESAVLIRLTAFRGYGER